MADVTIPPGTYSVRQFATLANVNRRTVQLWLKAEKFQNLENIQCRMIDTQWVIYVTKPFVLIKGKS
jgi:hypothetical protein